MFNCLKFLILILLLPSSVHAADPDQITQILDSQTEVERSKLVSEAQKGSLEHQYKLGVFYYRRGDVIAARGWLTKASEKGYAPAQEELSALLVDRHYGDANNPEESLGWLIKAAQNGYAKAKYGLSMRYQYGVGGAQKDLHKSLQWLEAAAESGHPSAQSKLGKRLILGDGVEKDEVMGYVWLLRAEDNGSPMAGVQLQDVSSVLSSGAIDRALEIFLSGK